MGINMSVKVVCACRNYYISSVIKQASDAYASYHLYSTFDIPLAGFFRLISKFSSEIDLDPIRLANCTDWCLAILLGEHSGKGNNENP